MSDHKDEKAQGGLRAAKLEGFKPIPANESKWAKHMREAGEEQMKKVHQQKVEKQQKYNRKEFELKVALEQEPPKKPKEEGKEEVKDEGKEKYHGYNKRMVDQFTEMGYSVEQVVAAFEGVGIDKAEGEYYELEEEYLGDVTAKLFSES